jgi:type VI secretion system protein ImpA
MTLEALLEPRRGGGASGDNLEYDPAFVALEMAAQPKAERQIGETVVAAEEPDHPETIRLALDVLERAHDLRAAVHLARARLRTQGIEGFAPVVGYIRSCLETWWDTCHPQLDPDDDNDPTMRINAVLGLAAQEPTLRYLMAAPLAESPVFGRISLRAVAIASGEIAAPANDPAGPDLSTVAAAFRDTRVEVLRERLDALRAIQSDVAAINAVFDDRTPGQGPDLDPLSRLLRKAVMQLASVTGDTQAAADDVDADPSVPAGVEPPRSPGPGGPGRIASPADVRAALDAIIAYYAAHEPSSPLPLLLQRARRLVGADFLTIMNDIAPDGVESVRTVAGLKSDDD